MEGSLIPSNSCVHKVRAVFQFFLRVPVMAFASGIGRVTQAVLGPAGFTKALHPFSQFLVSQVVIRKGGTSKPAPTAPRREWTLVHAGSRRQIARSCDVSSKVWVIHHDPMNRDHPRQLPAGGHCFVLPGAHRRHKTIASLYLSGARLASRRPCLAQ